MIIHCLAFLCTKLGFYPVPSRLAASPCTEDRSQMEAEGYASEAAEKVKEIQCEVNVDQLINGSWGMINLL